MYLKYIGYSLTIITGVFCTTLSAQTTRTNETTNNTAACSAQGYGLNGTPYCGAAFPGFTDASTLPTAPDTSTVPLTQPHNPPVSGAWHISKGRGTAAGDVHSLLYPGNTTLVFAELQSWFCEGSTGSSVTVDNQTFFRNQPCPIDGKGRLSSSSHLSIGYDSNDQNHADALTNDLWDRGFDGVVMDWAGDSNTCRTGTGGYANNAPFNVACAVNATNVDQSYHKIQSSFATLHPTMKVAMMYDDAAFKFANACATKDENQPQCVQNKMLADFNVLAATWFKDSNYLFWNNQPVVFSFIDETSDPAITFSQCNSETCNVTGSFTCSGAAACWSALWDGLRSNFLSKGYDPYLLFQNPSHHLADGSYSWVQPEGGTTKTTAAVQNNGGQFSILNGQMNSGAGVIKNGTIGPNGQKELYVAGAWKGFDDRMASWSPSWNQATGTPFAANVVAGQYPRTASQQCGTTWLKTMQAWNVANTNQFSTTVQLPFLMVGTWDDYEEGTEIETGIDNCMNSIAASLNGTTLGWTVAFKTGGTETTIDHYTVYYSTDGTTGESIQSLTDVPVDTTKNGSYTLDLSTFATTIPASAILYVEAVGKPSLTDHLSAGVTYSRSGSASISGVVTNLQTGGAIASASVTYSGSATPATTDSTGHYSFSNVTAGTYSVSAIATGYPQRTYPAITVASGQTVTQNLQLTTTGRLTGTVTGSGGATLSGASVTISGGDIATTDPLTTNSSGVYLSNWDPVGSYTVTCSATGYGTQTISAATISTGTTNTINCALSNVGTISGTVTNLQTGGPLSAATVTCSGCTGSATSDANGNYSLTGITSGTYSVTGTRSGYLTRTYNGIVVQGGSNTTANLQLSTSGKIGGVAKSPSGAVIAGATVTISGGDIPTTDPQTTNSSGAYLSNWDPNGVYTVTCQASGFTTKTFSNVTITAGATTTQNCQF